MNLNEFQAQAATTSLTTSQRGGLPDLAYYAIGLGDESGEVLGKVKKYYRDGNVAPEAIAYELGDVLWYLAMLAKEIGYSLDDIARLNGEKLAARAATGKIHGNGDKR